MNKIIAVTSGKGGVGKSTFSVGIAGALESLGKTVLLIDLDSGFRCLDLMLGVSEKVVFDLSDVLCERATLLESVVKPSSSLHLLAAPFKAGSDCADLSRLANEASNKYDFVIFDFPAGFSEESYRSLPDTALFITVATPDPICVRDASAVTRALRPFANNRRLVINRFHRKGIRSGLHCGVDDLIDSSATRLLGVVPEDVDAATRLARALPLKKGDAKKAYKRIAKRICGETVKLKLK